MNHYGVEAQITINYQQLHKCSPLSQIIGWVKLVMIELSNRQKNILPEGIRLKENFYASKSMKKSRGLGYHKIDICHFCMLYYLENTKLVDCRTCKHAQYKSKTGNLDNFYLLLNCKGYSCLQRLLNISHDIIKLMQWMES
jgi:hypothetical protein